MRISKWDRSRDFWDRSGTKSGTNGPTGCPSMQRRKIPSVTGSAHVCCPTLFLFWDI